MEEEAVMKRNIRTASGYVLLLILLETLFLANLYIGSAGLRANEITAALLGGGGETARRIVWDIRLPRCFAAVLLGGALSVAGFQLQSFFNNPIAGPFVLGISSSAKLAVALTMVFCLGKGVLLPSTGLIFAAFAGSLLCMLVLLAISRRVQRMPLLVVCGVMTGYICSAVTDFVVTFADDSNIVNLHNWSLGSFSGMNWNDIVSIAYIVLPALVCSFLLVKPMEACRLGDAYAANSGVNLKRYRVCLILLSCLQAACVTAFAGPVSFVGIAVPHLVRNLLKSGKPLLVLPACFLGGGAFCLFCDLLGRCLFAPAELNISSVTAVFGAPVVIWILLKRKGGGRR